MYKYVSLVLLSLFFYSCTKKSQPTKSASVKSDTISVKANPIIPIFKKDLFDTNDSAVSNTIEDACRAGYGLTSKGVNLMHNDVVLNLYVTNAYKLFWAGEKRFSDALNVLKESEHEGLNLESYNYSRLNQLYTLYKSDNVLNEQEIMELEILMTTSMNKYVHDLYLGRINPVTIYPEWNYKRPSEELVSDSILVENFNKNINTLTEKYRPKIFLYSNLRTALIHADSLEARGFTTTPITYIGKKLVKGDTSYVIIDIKKRLHATTEYDFNSFDNVFDEELFQSIKIFQRHVGVHPTGEIDKITISELNFTPNEIRNTIRANMERCRWFDNNIANEFILVNIPDYTLTHFQSNRIMYSEVVIVGKQLSQTPVFQSNITTVEFNPYWTVPRSIATKEILPLLKKDPGYLKKHNMSLYKNDSVVAQPPSFTSYSESNFPFVIKENPGPENSLGQVKFLFPNPYSIYMHDTPAKYLFDNDFRSYSHGCIRLHNPIKFANYLLDKQGFTPAQIDDIVHDGMNYAVAVENRIPIMISYFTCYMRRGDDHLYFFNDVYGSDKKIIDALKK